MAFASASCDASACEDMRDLSQREALEGARCALESHRRDGAVALAALRREAKADGERAAEALQRATADARAARAALCEADADAQRERAARELLEEELLTRGAPEDARDGVNRRRTLGRHFRKVACGERETQRALARASGKTLGSASLKTFADTLMILSKVFGRPPALSRPRLPPPSTTSGADWPPPSDR